MDDNLKAEAVDAATASVSVYGLLSHREETARDIAVQLLETLGALGYLSGQVATAVSSGTAVHGYYLQGDPRHTGSMQSVLGSARAVAHQLAQARMRSSFAVSAFTRERAAIAIADAVLAKIVVSGSLVCS